MFKTEEASPSPWLLSFGLHALLLTFAFSVVWFSAKESTPTVVELEVITHPTVAPPQTPPLPPPRAPELSRAPPPPTPPRRAVFGVSKQAITAEGTNSGLTLKAGNTIAKAEDTEKLNPQDEEALPVPTDEFLVTAMPQLTSEIRIPYPPAAKAAGIEGAVVMDLLIDAAGAVREAKLIEGPHPELNTAALTAIQRFRFTPARMKDQNVAVKIRYAYKFILER